MKCGQLTFGCGAESLLHKLPYETEFINLGSRDQLDWSAVAIKVICWVSEGHPTDGCLTGLLHSPSEVLVSTWSRRDAKALDWIEFMRPLPSHTVDPIIIWMN